MMTGHALPVHFFPYIYIYIYNKFFAGKSLHVRVVPVQPVWEPPAAPLPADVGTDAEEDPQALGVGGLIYNVRRKYGIKIGNKW